MAKLLTGNTTVISASEKKEQDTQHATSETATAEVQINKSKIVLHDACADGMDALTVIQIQAQARNHNHVMEEEKKAMLRNSRKQANTEECNKLNLDFLEQWEKCALLTDPYTLQAALEKLQSLADVVLNKQNKLVQEYVVELKSKDEEYVRELKRQAEDLESMLESSGSHFKKYTTFITEEIANIEDALMKERKENLDLSNEVLFDLSEQRRTTEEYNDA